jgi:histidinol dehydrogenase/sulfopropanediol 3-dehydrogenase
LRESAGSIISKVKNEGERAVLGLEERFSGVHLDTVRVDMAQVKAARAALEKKTLDALLFAAERIREFALKQKECLLPLNYQSAVDGLELGHTLSPVESCGCYVPAGRHPLPSSALMSVIAAKSAGVPRIAACSPPVKEQGGIHPAVLAAFDIAGADEVYCMGGAQAIAAFACGLPGILKPVDFIAGPGNRYVTEAKRQLAGTVGIDSLAGPSEVLIIADGTANPDFIAIDLLAQCEHDAAACAILAATDRSLISKVEAAIEAQLAKLDSENSGADTARQSWQDNGEIYHVRDLDEAADFANRLAPEHIEVQTAPEVERAVAGKLTAYGSLFAGHYAPAVLGDFVSGTNHILPTARSARFSSGLWVGSFMRVQFRQFVSKKAFDALAAPCAHFAAVEGLAAHRASILTRNGGGA